MKLPDKFIKDIAELLERGMKCYVNKATGEMKDIPDFDDMDFMDEEDNPFAEDLAAIEKWDDPIVLEKMGSHDSFRVMESFIPKVANPKLRQRLINALEKHGPFRNFRYIIDDQGEEREQWFKHRQEQYETYVRRLLALEFEPAFDLDFKTFVLVTNSENGEVDATTKFEYEQEGNLITADYEGGTIRYGKIVAELQEDQTLQMLYHCMTTDDILKAGRAIGTISIDAQEKMHLHLQWEWLSGDEGEGMSEYVEV